MDERLGRLATEFPGICLDEKIDVQQLDSLTLMMLALSIEDATQRPVPDRFWTMSVTEILRDGA